MAANRRPRVERFDAVTEDPGEIDQLTELMFGTSVRVERSDGRAPSLRLGQAGVAEFGAQRVTWNVDGRCDVAPLKNFLCIRLRRGAYGLNQGDGQVLYSAGDTFLADPNRRVEAEVTGADLDSLTIEGSALQAIAAQIDPWSRGRLDYRRLTPISDSLASAWDACFDLVRSTLGRDELVAENALIRASLLYQLVGTACAAFDLLPDAPRQRPATERSVRRAVTYIDDHLAEPITVGDIASAAGVSVRALQYAFLRVLSVSPSSYLRRARLTEARRELLDGETTVSISEVSRRWGFAHRSRFSAAYQDEFGELPSATLRS